MDALSFAELIFFAVIGAGVLGVGVYFGVRAAFQRGGALLAWGIIALLVLIVGILLRDAKRRSWSLISISMGLAWITAIALLVLADIMNW